MSGATAGASVARVVTPRGLAAEIWRQKLEDAEGAPVPGDLRSVVVATPHPDDETLGVGGLLHRLATRDPARRPLVTVAFVTDGAAGYPGVSAEGARWLTGQRRREAEAALQQLGLDPGRAVFFDLPDGGAAADEPALAERLGSLLVRTEADFCLAPWPLDPHPDHQAVGRAALAATRGTTVTLWQYPIWMRHSIRPGSLAAADAGRLRVLRLDGPGRAAKWAAIDSHASQVRSPFAGYGPVLPGHVLDLFADGLEPFFVPERPEERPVPADRVGST